MKVKVSTKFLEKLKNNEENYEMVEELSRKKIIGSLSLGLATFFVISTAFFTTGMKSEYNDMLEKNAVVYEEQLNVNQKHIDEYAKEIKSLNLTDLQIIMKVMNDIWAEIDGYGVAENLPVGYCRLAFQEEGKGVCTSFADEFTTRMNTINKDYNARNIIVKLNSNEIGNLKTCDIEQTVLDVPENLDEETLTIPSLADLTGNHMVSIIDIPNTDITLMVDTTNLLIGIFKNGKIYVLNNNSFEFIEYSYILNGMCSEYGIENYLFKLNKNIDEELIEEVNKNYGYEAQEKALEYIKNFKKI